MSSIRKSASLALALLPGCINNFDPSLYMTDASVGDAGPTLTYVDICTSIVPSVIPTGTTVFSLDTTSAADNLRNLTGCLGTETVGNDVFMAFDALPNERWHFHVRQTAPADVDPALYILDDCDERACQETRAINACRGGANEHLSFVAPAAGGRFIVGVDSVGTGGFTGTLEIYRPTCGNGTAEHSENCDDGNTNDGDGCDALCRRELTEIPLTEFGVNDDFYASNHILDVAGAVVLGDVGACDVDVYAVTLAAGSTVDVELTGRGGGACPSGAPEMRMSMLAPSGTVEVLVAPQAACPTMSFNVPAAGTYFVRLTSPDARPFDYDLRFDVTSP